MDQRITTVTLGVHDLGRSRRFYEDLGWRGQEVEETVFFQAGGQALVLWGREKLAADSGVDDDGSTFGGLLLDHNVRSSDEADELIAPDASACAQATRRPADPPYGGAAGCFRDPAGPLLE